MSTTTRKIVSSSKQAGMVSIMVTLILMIVISLIVLGFAQISRRNQRQSLDRQLSTQAFYAAETGVNDVANVIKSQVQLGVAVAAKPSCSGGGVFYAGLPSNVLDNTHDVSYTCLTVDPSPTTLLYSDVGTTSAIVPLNASSGTIANVKLTWNSKDDSSTPIAGCPGSTASAFKTTPSWTCGYGVLRFDLVPTSGPITMNGLQTATMTSFTVPLSGAGSNSVGYVAGAGNDLVGVRCSNVDCHLTITGLTQASYYMRVSSQYKDVSLQISATSGAGTAVNLTGAQAVIDSTGKAQDVLRRIQVHVPLTASSHNLLSDYAIESTDAVCKRFVVMDGYFLSYADAAVPGLGATTTNPLCK